MQDPSSQELFAGKYRLLKLLGRGAMGEVWLAVEEGPRNFKRYVALKRLLSTEGMSDFARESFVAEAQVIARLDHPNIVRLIELGESDDRGLYLALDFVDGSALDRIIRKGGPLSTAAVALLGREVCRALDAVHTMSDPMTGQNLGVVHRDVSPANILVGRDGRIRLSDFGVARITGLGGEKTETGVFKGKLPYMPPEQALGQPFDGRADVFSAGITFYEALLGGRLRKAETQGQLIAMIATERVPQVATTIPDAHPLLAQALDAATEFDHNQRLGSAGQLAQLMQQILHSLGPQSEQQAIAELRARVEQVAGGQEQGSTRQPWSMNISGENPAHVAQPITSPSGGYLSVSGQHLAASGQHPPSQPSGPHLSASGQHLAASGQHLAASGQHPQLGSGQFAVPSGSVPPGAPQTSVTRIATITDAVPKSGNGSNAWVFALAAVVGVGAAAAAAVFLIPKSGGETQATPGQATTSAPSAEVASAPSSEASAAPSAAVAALSAEPSASAIAATTGAPVPVGGRPRPRPTATTAPEDTGSETSTAPGTLVVVVNPWGNVSVDGRSYGATPLAPISLPPGPHTVIVTNPELGASRSAGVKIVGGKPSTVKFDLKKSD